MLKAVGGKITAQDLNDNFSFVDSKIEENEKLHASPDSIFKSPVMADTVRGNGKVPDTYDPDAQLQALIDPLLGVEYNYGTKRSLGKDESGAYDIWCYEFTPEKYEKTILLTANIHGNEYTSFYWLAQFLELLVNDWKTYPHLAYIRKNVRLVTVPIVNPWGHANQSRENVNNVDLNRNFDYNWGISTDQYNQGPSAFSEAESRAIRDLMAEIADECVATLDFHTTTSEGDSHYVIYYPRWLKNDVSNYLSVVDELKEDTEKTALASTTLPTLTNWGVYKHGFNGANPEFVNGLVGSTRSSEEMTRAMNFFANNVFQAARTPFRAKGAVVASPQVYTFKYDHRTDGGTIPFSSTSYTSQTNTTSVRFDVKNEGVFEVDGHIVFSASQDAEVSLLPQLYQVSSPNFSFSDTQNDEFHAIILNVKAGQEYIIPFHAAIQCHKSSDVAANNTNSRAKEVVFQLRTKISAGSGDIKFLNGKARFTPSTSGDRFRRYGLNPARILYPTGQETAYEF